MVKTALTDINSRRKKEQNSNFLIQISTKDLRPQGVHYKQIKEVFNNI